MWTSACPSVRTPAASSRSRSCRRVERPLLGQRALDDRPPRSARGGDDALLRQPPRVAGEQRRRRQRVQPRVVLAAHEVQRPAVEPRDDERAVLGQRAVDVGGRQPGGPRADRQPRAARVLRLHGEQPLGDGDRSRRGRPGEQLRGETLGDHRSVRRIERGQAVEDKVNLAEKLAALDAPFQPADRRVPERLQAQVAKAKGEFVWHAHPETDDFFLVVEGRLTIQLRDRDVELGPGELFVVPRGVEHCPRSDEGAEILLIEPAGTVNTGDARRPADGAGGAVPPALTPQHVEDAQRHPREAALFGDRAARRPSCRGCSPRGASCARPARLRGQRSSAFLSFHEARWRGPARVDRPLVRWSEARRPPGEQVEDRRSASRDDTKHSYMPSPETGSISPAASPTSSARSPAIRVPGRRSGSRCPRSSSSSPGRGRAPRRRAGDAPELRALALPAADADVRVVALREHPRVSARDVGQLEHDAGAGAPRGSIGYLTLTTR